MLPQVRAPSQQVCDQGEWCLAGGHGADSYPGGGLDEIMPQVPPGLAALSRCT